MSSAEFAEWRAYQRLVGPLAGPSRDDWRSALVASLIANVNRDQKKRRKPYSPEDFIPDWLAMSGVRKVVNTDVADKVKGWFQSLKGRGK
jgi:hypothetical protein